MNHDQLAIVAFFLALPPTVAGWVCSLKILHKMRFDGFGTSDLWNPTGKMYRRYVQEAKRHNWSLLPVYIPAILFIPFFCYFLVAVILVLRDTF
jgi:disulfide bond formation protein DsbB